MFSKSKINEPGPKKAGSSSDQASEASASSNKSSPERPAMPLTNSSKPKPAVSTLSTDLTIVGNLRTTGDIMVEGHVQGDIRAHLLTVGETATIEGEIVADDIVVNGRVIGRVRGLKVRLTATAKVEGDIVHKTIAIESGAHFEGSVQRQEDPLASGSAARPAGSKPPMQRSKPADADA